MAGPAFDIYQAEQGYVTVSNEVQRSILLAAAGGPKSFADLVTATGRSKPTVSLQIKDLVERKLLTEKTSPEDRRRRFYTLTATRIGSSDLPVGDLRNAVQSYVQMSSEPSLRLRVILEALTEGGPSKEVAWTQARAMGQALAGQMQLDQEGGAWLRLARFLEKAGLAKTARIDVEAGRLDCDVAAELRGPPALLGAALAGLVDGAWAARGAGAVAHSLQGRRLALWAKATPK